QDELALASLRKFLSVMFRPAVAGLLECALPARRVRASSRRFWGRRPLIEKRCEDALALATPKAFARPHFPPRRAGSARCRGRILTYPYPCNPWLNLWLRLRRSGTLVARRPGNDLTI